MAPLPWKKGKFSRMVNDHLNSAKQGGSMVETGFPTSIVDLFVKNRDGIKRSCRKKKDRKSDVESFTCGESLSPFRPGLRPPERSVSSPEAFYQVFTPSPTISPRSSSFSSSPVIWRTPRNSFSGSPIESFSGAVNVGDEGKVADAKGVIYAILKVFFVVALALGTKQFVFGLIISSFSLIFMEFFIWSYLCKLLKPCQNAQITFKHFIEHLKRTARWSIEDQSKSNQMEEALPETQTSSKPNYHLKPPRGKDTARTVSLSRSFHLRPESEEFPIGRSLSHCRSLNWLSQEMDRREESPKMEYINKNHHRSGSKIKSKIIKLLTSKKKDEIEDPVSDSEQKISKSRSSRLKSKIKKIIASNRLRGSKKQQTNQQNNLPPGIPRTQDPTVCQNQEQSYTYPPRIDKDREDAGSVSSQRSPDTKAIVEERRNEYLEKTPRNLGCWIGLLPIILLGLMAGRLWAIAFTLAWCFVWTFLETSRKATSCSVASR